MRSACAFSGRSLKLGEILAVPDFATIPDEMPEPTAEMVLFRVHVEVLISLMGRKKADRYLRLMAEKLADEENLSAVFKLRRSAKHEALRKAHQDAALQFQRFLPVWLARASRD
jgi:hypothetical protein